MEQQIHFCTTDDGVRIAYATVGEGPPLVKAANWLNHLEFDWHSPIWRHLLQEFSRDHLLLRYDERGNGLSDWNVDNLTFDAFVQDLEAVVDAVGLDRFPILGISQGGPVAIAYAVRHPEKVSHLILYGTYARGFDLRESSAEEIERRQAELTLIKVGWGQDNPAFRQLWTTLFLPDATPEEWDSFNDLHRVSTSPENAVRLLNEFGRINVLDLLSQVKVPTLVMHCRDESVVPFEEGRLLAARIPGARFVPLEGKNHLLLEADSAWTTFVSEVRRFLGTALTTPGERRTKDGGSRDQPKFTQADLPERYSILSSLGAGGMGEVYLAEDTKLGRKVALKTLPAEFTNDKDRLRRFQQEARAASALNHPNILTIHEIGAESGAHFIATEFVDGETLRAKLNRGRIKLDEALDVAQQTTFALTAAHGAGIVHRDIKPENIMVRHDGIVKVLDFGLAKLLEGDVREMIDPEAKTRALLQTEPGKVMGTPAYMSPEQARGLDLDARTDVWSQGVVLYEMVAGRAPFRGETTSHTVVSILETEPAPLATFAPETPPELQRIVRKALNKDRDSRYQTARDFMIDLKSLRRDLDIQSEIRRSSAADISAAEAAVASQPVAAKEPDADLSDQPTSLTEPRPTRSDSYTPDGSIRYRIGALIGMLLLALAALAVWYTFHRQNGGAPIESIAVLPFVNASNDPNAEYLSDGIAESLMNSLSQLPNLKVMSRNTAYRYKGKDQDARKVGSELNVRSVLTGSVKQVGDQIVVRVSLDDALDNHQIWGEQYTRRVTDLFAVQGEIAKEISDNLQLRLSGAERERLTKRPTENAEAYELYLKGYHSLYKFTDDGIRKSRDYFQQAIEKDPNYAPAYAGLAEAYLDSTSVIEAAEASAKAKQAAQKAAALDASLAEAHYALALVSFQYDLDWSTAEREFQQAIKLKPNYALAYDWYGFFLGMMGRFDEAYAQFKRGLEIDPLSLPLNADVGTCYYWERRYDQAIEQFHKTLDLDPAFPPAIQFQAETYAAKGQYAEALQELEKIKSSTTTFGTQGFVGYVYAKWGKRSEAERVLAELLKQGGKSYVAPDALAVLYTGLGEKDKAFEAWQTTCRKISAVQAVKVDPIFDDLRSDPRFPGLVRCVGLNP